MIMVPSDSIELRLDGQAVAGLREQRLSLKRALVDRTDQSSTGWAQVSAFEKPVGAEISGHGVFISAETMDAVRMAFFEGAANAWSLELPGDGTWSGAFLVRHLEFTGRAEDLLAFSIRMTSTGPVTFTPGS